MSPAAHSPAADEDDELDDLPETHLDEDAYEEFVRRELDAAGNIRPAPPVTVILVVLMVIVLALAFVLLR